MFSVFRNRRIVKTTEPGAIGSAQYLAGRTHSQEIGLAMSDDDKTVCYSCLREPEYLSNFIRSNASARFCSYCGRTSRQPNAIPLDDLMEVISAAVSEEYEDAA